MKYIVVIASSILVSFSTLAQDDLFILKDSAYFKNSDFSYSDSDLHGRLIWYSNTLLELGEPVLMDLKTSNVIFRLLLVGNSGRSIRIVKSNSSYTLYYKDISKQYEVELTNKQWRKSERKINRANFWKLPTRNDRSGKDGVEWILEGNKEGTYHVVDRWSPRKITRFRKACNYLTKLALDNTN